MFTLFQLFIYSKDITVKLYTVPFDFIPRSDIAGFFLCMHFHLDYILPNCSLV